MLRRAKSGNSSSFQGFTLNEVKRDCRHNMKALKVSQVLFILTAFAAGLSGCFVQTMNSVDGDAKAFQPLSAAGSNAAFSQVRTIIQKNCATCHSNFVGFSESDFASNHLIVPNHPEDSVLFQNLKGSGAGNGEMPKDGAPLSAGDIQAIRAWIQNMGVVAPSAPLTPFGQAQIVINNSCVTCHKDLSGAKESDFVTRGWVVPGNAEASRLYYKLLGSNVTGETTPDMPLGGPALATTDLQSLHQWIEQMNPGNFPAPTAPANTAFGKVQKIIGDNCIMCHKKFGANAESDFVTQQLVTPGNTATSTFYTVLIGSLPLSNGSNMPKAGAPLTKDQIQDVAEWINQMPVPPSATDLAITQIRASFEQNIKPLVQRGCMDCHDSMAKPDGWIGQLPVIKQIEEKHIVDASARIDFSQPYPNWSKQSEDPVFYLNEIQTALQNGSMPPSDYKILHEHDGGILKPTETQTILTWVTQSQALLQASDTSKPTASKFFSQKCLGCHNSSSASGGLAFQNTNGVITVPAGTANGGIPFITRMNPQNSAVYLVLLADPTARKGLEQMPFKATASQLATDDERKMIMDWINQ
jgi:mono/diheme cytochrome c family protein